MSKRRATDEILGQLHETLAKDLLKRIESGVATPAELNAAIKFLQNNNIEAVAEAGDTLSKLYESLPTFEDDELPAN